MNFIKVKTEHNKTVLVNLSNVTHFFQVSDTVTTICFVTPEDYIKIAVPIKVLEEKLELTNGTRVVYTIY
jgi:hypothetical protein